MSARYILFLILGLDALVLFLQIEELSISHSEALLYFGEFSFLQFIIKSSTLFFGQNDFALRTPMIVLHIFSALLLYNIAKKYVKLQKNRVWLTLVFILLPGVISSAIIVNMAGFMIFALLFFIYIYDNYSLKYSYLLLVFYMLIDGNFVYLFIALGIFSWYKRERDFFLFNILLLIASLLIYGIDTHGSPKGYFLDSLGLYAAIFTPIIFVYLVYILYRRYLTKEINILWFIATIAFVLSLILSFRQRINIEYFAPYLILALPLMAQTFEHSYRVRLSIFRKNYKIIFITSLIFLILNSSVVFFNKYIYMFIENPKKHFSYNNHVAKELSSKLKEKGISCIDSNKKMANRLEFYGVTKCNMYKLEEEAINNKTLSNVTISYKNIVVYRVDVTKINKN